MRIFRKNQVSVCVVAVWMMVLSAATTELYYERLGDELEYQIENENKLDPEGAYEMIGRAEEDLRKSELLRTLLQYVQNLKEVENEGPTPKVEDEAVTWSNFSALKKAGIKKWMAALSSNASSKLMSRNLSQRQWKIKKGTSVVCYFKLCSFQQST